MPKSIYEDIYQDLKKKIEDHVFPSQELLPSENTLITQYNCSRNTIRRAIAMLATEGYVQSIRGKGVRNIYEKTSQTLFTLGEIESFRESARRNHMKYSTKVLLFMELAVDESLHQRTSFPLGSQIYYIQRIHYLNDLPLIINHNYFLKSCTPGLTREICEQSIYNYLENVLQMTIINSRRIMTVEKMTEIDEKYLKLDANEYNCMAVVTSYTYNSDGIMFEFTQSRHRPDHFRFQDNAIRHK